MPRLAQPKNSILVIYTITYDMYHQDIECVER